MKIRHILYTLLPALAMADNATTVPDDEPWHPPLPEELLHPQTSNAALPATAQPVVSYRAPKDEEQTWLKLLYVKDTEEWPGIFRRMAAASHEKDMQMCHGYSLWLKGHELLHLRYDDDLSLSGIHADGHAYGVLFVEFNPYGIRVCPMEGYDLTGKNGGVCWQDAATRLWSWAEAEKFWAELPKLLRADTKTRATSAHDTAIKREVATLGQRMVVFWAPAGYAAKQWWPSFARLHAAVGPKRFSLVAFDGLNLWSDVSVPAVKLPSGKTVATPVAPSPQAQPGSPPAATAPTAPTPITAAPPLHALNNKAGQAAAAAAAATTATPGRNAAPGTAATAPAATAPAAKPATQATAAKPATQATAEPAVPAQLQPAGKSSKTTAPDASVRPWALENGVAPAPSKTSTKAQPSTTAASPAASAASTPAAQSPPAEKPAEPRSLRDVNPVLP